MGGSVQAVKKEAVFLYSLGYRSWVKNVISGSCQCNEFDLGASDTRGGVPGDPRLRCILPSKCPS